MLVFKRSRIVTGTLRGLNDGTIYPDADFESSASLQHMREAALRRTSLRGAIRVAVVLVEFTDRRMRSDAASYFKRIFFSNGSMEHGSVTEYFSKVSNGNISLTGEVVGPVSLQHSLSYYANGESGMSASSPNAQNLAADALAAANTQINFKPYDNDGNGYVDAFIVVHAGSGAEETGSRSDIWSLKWVLPQVTSVDDVNVYAFLTIPEDANIGVCAHEIGHLVFGWPDLYDTDGSSQGIGNWCLMAGGSWGGNPAGVKPCHPSAWCKQTQGWIRVSAPSTSQDISLGEVENYGTAYRLWSAGDTSSKEYFLLENRESVDFDGSLPGSGLLVWHVDDTQVDNSDEIHPKVGLEQADGLNQLATITAGRGDSGDPFPGLKGNTSFTSTSNPSSLSYGGRATGVSITNISPASQRMNMKITV
ncbi:hypothetical protein PEX1_086260 [Penicillium expansum]|nr:hypothetical protein PEX1_086260 [Penicillium expansum]